MYNHLKIEKKWRERWNNYKITDNDKPKYYCLDMFPYPSANGLHVGHWRGYVLSDIISRYKILQGYNVLHPIGFDAFGLPAENYSIKVGMHPKKVIKESIKNYKRQLNEISAIYNWDREINTTDPSYYKWTQWIFIKMFEKGLAYEKEMPLNWCENCKAVLSNEESTNGKCDRCGSVVTKKMLRQWMLKITEYAERLLKDLDNLEWPEKVKKMQSEWIGKSIGAKINFSIENMNDKIKVYTTKPETLYGVTSILLSPEHSIIKKIVTEEEKNNVDNYISNSLSKSYIKRMSEKEKTGVFTGRYAIHPINNKKIPIWISDYVLNDYGTGAIMSVPAHDNRDYEFAKKYKLPIIKVINEYKQNCTDIPNKQTINKSVLINSDLFNNMELGKARESIINYLEKNKLGEKSINYKLRDWVFSRQRYWGEPIPLIHCENCGVVAVDEKDLPVVLPDVESYHPTETGESPLANIEDWVNTKCPKCSKKAKRETNTMPQWAGSSWYFLRYLDPNNNKQLASTENIEKWMPVDIYIGGIEHAVLHLLYARFYTKFLYDIGVVNFEEPFKKLFNQGMLNRNGSKMSKSKGNIVSPDDIVKNYGCDSLRLYELFIGPPELDIEWDDSGIDGVYRYLKKLWKLVTENKNKIIDSNEEFEFIKNKLIYEVTTKMDKFNFNTIVSTFMEYTNKIIDLTKKNNGIDKNLLKNLIILISPFTPHIAEEMWEIIGNKNSVFTEIWPKYNLDKLKRKEIEIALQINGKFKDNLTINIDENKENILDMAKEVLKSKLYEKEIIKEIYVPNKIVNIVVKY